MTKSKGKIFSLQIIGLYSRKPFAD